MIQLLDGICPYLARDGCLEVSTVQSVLRNTCDVAVIRYIEADCIATVLSQNFLVILQILFMKFGDLQ